MISFVVGCPGVSFLPRQPAVAGAKTAGDLFSLRLCSGRRAARRCGSTGRCRRCPRRGFLRYLRLLLLTASQHDDYCSNSQQDEFRLFHPSPRLFDGRSVPPGGTATRGEAEIGHPQTGGNAVGVQCCPGRVFAGVAHPFHVPIGVGVIAAFGVHAVSGFEDRRPPDLRGAFVAGFAIPVQRAAGWRKACLGMRQWADGSEARNGLLAQPLPEGNQLRRRWGTCYGPRPAGSRSA
jgi:hypothetical protein